MSNTVSLGETMGHSDYNDKVVAQCIKREAQLNMASDQQEISSQEELGYTQKSEVKQRLESIEEVTDQAKQ